MIRELAVAGEGIALLPSFIAAADLRAGRLTALLSDTLDADTAIYAVYPHRRHLSAKVRLFVDYLVGHCGPSPYWTRGSSPLGPTPERAPREVASRAAARAGSARSARGGDRFCA